MRLIPGAVILVGLALLAPSTTAAAATSSTTAGLEYVALGDSYSAGYGLLPLSPTSPASGCYQAEVDYPHLVATALGLDLDDRSCAGAVTANIRDTPQVTGSGTAPVQSDALSASTDIVTVTIGGNDLGFASIAGYCVALTANGPIAGDPSLDNCKDHYNPSPGVDQLIDLLDSTVVPALAETFALIAAKAPNATVCVIGYPTIAPDAANIRQPEPPGCFTTAIGDGNPPFPVNSFPYTQTDTLYLHYIEKELDARIQAAATTQGFTYLPTWAVSALHSVCADDPHIFGISLTTDAQDGEPTPLPGIYLVRGALHPNTEGVDFFASTIIAAIEADRTRPALADTGGPDLLLPLGALAAGLLAAGVLLARRSRRAEG